MNRLTLLQLRYFTLHTADNYVGINLKFGSWNINETSILNLNMLPHTYPFLQERISLNIKIQKMEWLTKKH